MAHGAWHLTGSSAFVAEEVVDNCDIGTQARHSESAHVKFQQCARAVALVRPPHGARAGSYANAWWFGRVQRNQKRVDGISKCIFTGAPLRFPACSVRHRELLQQQPLPCTTPLIMRCMQQQRHRRNGCLFGITLS